MHSELSAVDQIEIHVIAIVVAARRGKLRPVHLFRGFSGICRALAG